ncbi:hypothetical protein [Alkalihalobacillus trypoxylicola]|uniref:Uncharacterized protein n=1 Tax=Alkalihalobacillus trypoxylicola TaxID=519424 RepID=A0A162CM24_9BACI|nr:hypothetical protein [Alkalihalobacillus trypoxylicola]KYG25530.1 hypothetical protein AZF04_13650 [Alkalihalobacillus trypoxylicola]
MSKQQTWFLSMTFIAFVLIWVFVIIQFTNSGFESAEQPADEEVETQEVVEVVIEEHQDQNQMIKEKADEEKKEETSKELVVDGNKLIDLTKYDFSDISTPDGIPIDGILSKVGLDK